MCYKEYLGLKKGDIVTPIGNSKDRGRLFKVVDAGEYYIGYLGSQQRHNGIWVEPIDDKPISVTHPMLEAPYYGNKKCRRYQYQAVKIVEQV